MRRYTALSLAKPTYEIFPKASTRQIALRRYTVDELVKRASSLNYHASPSRFLINHQSSIRDYYPNALVLLETVSKFNYPWLVIDDN